MKRIFIPASLCVLAATLAVAQEQPVIVLEFFEDDREIQILDGNDFDVNFFLGVALSVGDQIITGATAVEIRLDPSGSIVRIDHDTRFTIDAIAGRDQATRTVFTLTRGRMRMVAPRPTGEGEAYTIHTPNAVAIVRGTDFVIEVVPGQEPEANGSEAVAPSERLTVLEGDVTFESQISGERLSVVGGQSADVFATPFLPVEVAPERLAQLAQALAVESLDPSQVPGYRLEEDLGGDETDASAVPAAPSDLGAGTAPFERAAEVLGLQVGAVAFDGETYAQVVFLPRVEIGRFTLALYLPITYTRGLFDTGNWHRPGGNNEWSFGVDRGWSDDPQGAWADLGADVALKVHRLAFAERGDPFFLQVGNLTDFTLGQGLLMSDYANNIDAATVRNVGLNVGFDTNGIGFEAVVDNLARPGIVGGRLYSRPIPNTTPAAVGVSAIADLGPASRIATVDGNGAVLTGNRFAQSANPIFLNVAADLEIPIVRRDKLGITTFAEVGGLIPVLRNGVDGRGSGLANIDSGVRLSALFTKHDGIQNYGVVAGARGKIDVVDYRLAFQQSNGVFVPNFYGPHYPRLGERRAISVVQYLLDETDPTFDTITQGIDAQAGLTILGALDVVVGYFWPWEMSAGGDLSASSNDEFRFQVVANDGLIPLGFTAGLSYRRNHAVATIAKWGKYGGANLFDADTVLDAFVAYPANGFIDIVARVSTVVLRDTTGRIEYESDGDPRIGPAVSIQTRIGL